LTTSDNREDGTVSQNNEDSFRVIDKRPFTSEGELRPDVVAEQERESKREEVKEVAKAAANAASEKAAAPPAETPKKSPAFENLIRMIGSNAAMVLGAYADPRTGQPVIDPEAARELIDMLDALHEKTKGNLASEEDNLLLDLLGKLKMTYLEINQAMAAEMAKVTAQAKGGKK
jgi:HD superfamily phosphodiesterase